MTNTRRHTECTEFTAVRWQLHRHRWQTERTQIPNAVHSDNKHRTCFLQTTL